MDRKIKKVLVTGGGGFIGSHLCETLVKAGYDVHAFVRYNSRNLCGWIEYSPLKNEIQIEKGDICDFDSVNLTVRKVDAVCHLAALIGIPYSYVSPLGYIRTNIMGTYNVLEAGRQQNKKPIVHASTSETYGSAQYIPINEKHPQVGQSPYSATKIGADQLALSYALSFDMPVTIIRPFNTYGPRQSLRAIIPTIITQIVAKKDPIELGNLTTTRDFTYVSDTSMGFLKALQTNKGIGQVINLGTGTSISINDLAKKIMELMGQTVEVTSKNERLRPDKSEVKQLQSDNSLAKKLLGWEPKVSLEEGLKETISWISESPQLRDANKYVV